MKLTNDVVEPGRESLWKTGAWLSISERDLWICRFTSGGTLSPEHPFR